ncbi:uncharacterized protein LOC136074473 [Hydra vulgaris]|uniref:Uncharacterized protein LOC136074473 n=1 Tax=Hydra vulgaris TaxID=6087 RepID=A0ABM4B259_HYDVU
MNRAKKLSGAEFKKKKEIFIGQSQDEFGPNDSEAQEERNSQLSKPIEMGTSEFPPEISEISATSGENFQHSDPATWPKMTDKTRCILIQHGPEPMLNQKEENFSQTHFVTLTTECDTSAQNEISKGFCDWKKLNPRIPEHKNSNEHQRCYSDWKNLEKNLKEGKTLDSDLQRVISGEMKKWRDILKVIVDAILFCAKNNLALRK